MVTKYQVTKQHTAGILAGITTTETTSVRFEVGREYRACVGGGRYVVTECLEAK